MEEFSILVLVVVLICVSAVCLIVMMMAALNLQPMVALLSGMVGIATMVTVCYLGDEL